MLTELQEDNLTSLISENERVVVQFGASWCGACKLMKPKLRRLAEEEANQGVKFFYVDAEQMTQSRSITTIQNLPTFVGIVNGEIVAKETGSKIDNIKALVDAVANH